MWCDGVPLATGLESSRAFQYGDGVFRTLLRHRNQVIAVDAQLGRLAEDAARLDLDAPLDALRADIAALPPSDGDCIIKLMLVRAARGRGYAASGSASSRWVLQLPRPRQPLRCWREGIVAARAAIHLAHQPALAGIKHLNRLEQVLAYRGADAAVDEVICLDGDDEVVCGGRSNVFAVIDGVLTTPDLARCGIRGVTRDRVMQSAAALGIATRIAGFPLDVLRAADEAFVCNSVIGIWPLARFEARHWGAPGAVTRALQAALSHPLPESGE